MTEIQRPLILISNDDGVNATGIAALVEVAKQFGQVVVVAPEQGQSGMSHAITSTIPIRLRHVKEEDGASWYAVSGTPADCIKLAFYEVLKRKPDLVISGINHGSNASVAVIYSGTIGAAVEGTLYGIPSVGFSLLDHSAKADFTAAKKWFGPIIKTVLEKGLPKNILLNVNIPNIPSEKIKGYSNCRVTHGKWSEEYEKRTDPQGKTYYWLTGCFHNDEPMATDTDEWALANGYVSIVPLNVDWTSKKFLDEMKQEWTYDTASAEKQ
jgi:5'-nucleotidase